MDNTKYSKLAACEEEYVNRHVRHLHEVVEEKSPFFGQVVHEGVRVFYQTEDAEVARAAAGVYWKKKVPVWGEEKKVHLSREYAMGVVGMYGTLYAKDRRTFDMVMNERYLRLGEEDGIVDRVVRERESGLLYCKDLKSTGLRLDATYLRQYEFNQQAALQIDLAEAETGEEIAGFWLDGIHLDRRGYPVEGDFVTYGPLPYSKEQRVELAGYRARARERAARLAERPEEAVQETRSCFRFGGICSFFDICKAPVEEREDMRMMRLETGGLKVKEWKPGERDDE